MTELSIPFEQYKLTAEVAFTRVAHEDVAVPGVLMRVNFRADRWILKNENAGVAESGTKVATW